MKVLVRSVTMLVLCASAACGSASSTPQAPVSGSSASPRTSGSPTYPYVVHRLDAGNQPCAVDGGFGSVWVSVYGDDVELRIDPTTAKVIARIKTDFSPCGIAVGGGAVWVENYGGNSVTRIDPSDNSATNIPVGQAPYDVTFAAGAAWVTNYGDDTVSRIDAATRKVRTVKVGGSPVGVAPAADGVWVTNKLDGTLSHIDSRTLKVRTTKVGDQPAWTAWGGGRLWIANLGRVDQIGTDGRVERSVRLGAQPDDGDIVGHTVWVGDKAGALHAVDTKTGQVSGHWPLGLGDPFVLAGYDDLLWVVDFAGSDLIAVDPSKLG